MLNSIDTIVRQIAQLEHHRIRYRTKIKIFYSFHPTRIQIYEFEKLITGQIE